MLIEQGDLFGKGLNLGVIGRSSQNRDTDAGALREDTVVRETLPVGDYLSPTVHKDSIGHRSDPRLHPGGASLPIDRPAGAADLRAGPLERIEKMSRQMGFTSSRFDQQWGSERQTQCDGGDSQPGSILREDRRCEIGWRMIPGSAFGFGKHSFEVRGSPRLQSAPQRKLDRTASVSGCAGDIVAGTLKRSVAVQP